MIELTTNHVLIVGSMKYMHKKIREVPKVRTTLLIETKKISLEDIIDNVQVINMPEIDEKCISLVFALHNIDPITHIAAFSDQHQILASQIAQVLNLRFHTLDTSKAIWDKLLMRHILRESHVDNTASIAAETANDIRDFAKKYGWPVFVKPRSGQASIGISKVQNENEIALAVTRIFSEANGDSFIVEEALFGEEFSVEAFSEDGRHCIIAITKKYKDPITFVEMGHQLPAELTDEQQDSIINFIKQCLDALRVYHGPTHTEIMLTERGPRLIETHTRLGGDFIPELVQDILSVDLKSFFARQILGEKVLNEIIDILNEKISAPRNYAAVWYRMNNLAGKLEKIQGIEDIQDFSGVTFVKILKKEGTTVRSVQQSSDRLAAVRTRGMSPTEAIENAQKAINYLKFEIHT
jgi:biotin carboxylase